MNHECNQHNKRVVCVAHLLPVHHERGRESLTLISSAMVEKTASMWTRFPG